MVNNDLNHAYVYHVAIHILHGLLITSLLHLLFIYIYHLDLELGKVEQTWEEYIGASLVFFLLLDSMV